MQVIGGVYDASGAKVGFIAPATIAFRGFVLLGRDQEILTFMVPRKQYGMIFMGPKDHYQFGCRVYPDGTVTVGKVEAIIGRVNDRGQVYDNRGEQVGTVRCHLSETVLLAGAAWLLVCHLGHQYVAEPALASVGSSV